MTEPKWRKREWNDARKAELVRLWGMQITQVEIAELLNSDRNVITRQAIVLGLPKRRLNGGPPEWTKVQVAVLRKGWLASKSCAVIAREIGGTITKNAVIGKARRIGLPMRQNGRYGAGKGKGPRGLFRPKIKLPLKAPARPPARAPQPFKPTEVPIMAEPIPLNLTTMQLTDHTCKYGVGEATGEWQLFCGAASVRGSFCDYHYRLCWVPVTRRDNRRYTWRAA